jgi:hypothetical protein
MNTGVYLNDVARQELIKKLTSNLKHVTTLLVDLEVKSENYALDGYFSLHVCAEELKSVLYKERDELVAELIRLRPP